MTTICKLCKNELADVRSAWREQTGWVSPNGAKAMTLAKQTGELAHPECVSSLKHGVDPEQGRLM